jgi:chemotaxis family two-component system response regulator Rcp1
MLNRTRPIEILLVEDNPADVRLIEEGLNETRVKNVLHSVINGKDALDFVFRREEHADAPRPDLILLDLNLPGISGQEVLAAVKQDEGLRSIPVVVLTSSEAETEIRRAYENHANCFISKPVDFTSLIEVVGRIERFWFSTVRLPKVA